MPAGFFPYRCGDYLYDVTVHKTQEQRPERQYRARVEHVERLANGLLETVTVDVPDAYGATVAEAKASADAAMRRRISDHQTGP
jgi:hypothetical protein